MNLNEQAGKTSFTKLSQLIAAQIVASEKSVQDNIDNLEAGDIAFSNSDFTSNNVSNALTELFSKIEANDITVEQPSPGVDEGILSRTLIKKGGVTIGTINVPKDYLNNIVGIAAQDDHGNPGTFLKVNISAKGDEYPRYQYVDVSGLVEYVTSGSTSSDPIVISISNDHKVTASITNGSIVKTKLATAVQTSLDRADTAYQKPASGIAKNDLSADVKSYLDLADTAVQSTDINEVTASEIATIWNRAIVAART